MGDRWNGKINMNGDTAYNQNNFGRRRGRLPWQLMPLIVSRIPGCPAALGEYGEPEVVHPLDATWLLPSGTVATSHVLASIALNPAPMHPSCHT
ncbi:MAG: hypothetical protein MZW92_43550 [Comamonadaceae bacterium]|nr:hypothetical protein [Comamonadaceae bacterium]